MSCIYALILRAKGASFLGGLGACGHTISSRQISKAPHKAPRKTSTKGKSLSISIDCVGTYDVR